MPQHHDHASEAEPEFDDIADIYWRLGVLSSPSQLHGYLLGLLAVGQPLAEEQWLQLAEAFIDPVEPLAEVDRHTLLELLTAAREQLQGGGMELQLLLPDDAIEISQRVDSLGQWCKGFLAGFALGGKQRQQSQGQQPFPAEVSESLSDMAAISQAGLGEGDEDENQREKSFFELAEYLRLAAVNIYLECQRMAEGAESSADDGAGPVTAANLFSKPGPDDKLH